MGLCLKKSCRNCVRRCKSWFPHSKSLESACRAKCRSGSHNFKKCDFLENDVGDQVTIGYYSQDCDPNKGFGSEKIERNDQFKHDVVGLEREELNTVDKNTKTVFIAGIFILLLILSFIFLNKK